jgi:hypothetical protein
MPLTIDEILTHEGALEKEIAEKRALLAAYQLLRAQTAGQRPVPILPEPAIEAGTGELLPAPEKPAAAASPPATGSRTHPDLQAMVTRGNNGEFVSWAIKRMTDDYSVHQLEACLQNAGCLLRSAEISVVLTRLKARGEIEQIRPGSGRTPALFRKPASATALATDSTNQADAPFPPTDPSASK